MSPRSGGIMNTYRINFVKSAYKSKQFVEADNVNGFDPSSDTYTFKIDGEVVAAMPKSAVTSITKVSSASDT